MLKKSLSIALVALILVTGVSKAHAYSLEDAMADIASLKTQIGDLKSQLSAAVITAKSDTTATTTPEVVATTTKTVVSFTSKNITPNATGADVITLQTALKEAGYFTASVTGTYGAKTEMAVKAFQKANGLPTTGVVGDATKTTLLSSVTSNVKSLSSPSSVLSSEKVFLFGGYDSNCPVNDVYSSSNMVNWTQLLPTMPCGIVSPVRWSQRGTVDKSVYFNGKLWVLGILTGGFAGNASDVWSSPDGVTWTRVDTNPSLPGIQNAPWPIRSDHTVTVFNNKIWVMGGYNVSGQAFNDIWSSPDGVTWTHVDTDPSLPGIQDAPWYARYSFTSLSFNNKLWVIGGINPSTPASYSGYGDVWSSPDGVTWTQTTSSAPALRSQHTSVVFNDKMWIIGGQTTGFCTSCIAYNDVWSSSDGITWTQVTSNAQWSGRRSLSSVVFNNKIWVIAGENNSSYLQDVWSSPDGITWTQATSSPIWSPRLATAVVVTPQTFGVLPDIAFSSLKWNATYTGASTIYGNLPVLHSNTNQYIYFRTMLKNIGTVPLVMPPSTAFKMYKGSVAPANLVASITTASSSITIAPGASHTIDFTPIPSANLRLNIGSYNLILVADTANVIQESNETNNTITQLMTIN
jgi:peptidoglycan hydrolase-like protein with peptidoglycan-binding domain